MTTSLFKTPASWVWIALVAATCVSWSLGAGHGEGRETATAAILALAFVKVHLIGAHFMELRGAPRLFSRIFDGWCAGVYVLLMALYLLG